MDPRGGYRAHPNNGPGDRCFLMLQVTVPPQDEAIGSALADLESKLSAWVSAMTAAQDALVQQAVAGRQINESITSDDATASVLEVEAAPEIDATQPIAEEPAAEIVSIEETAESEVAAKTEMAQPAAEPVAAKPVVKKATRGIQPGPNFVPPPPVVAQEEAATAARSSSDEDEALLATLDEKTVKALRVMRRLSMTKKSMKELLAEYQAEQSGTSETSAPAKGSWWRRK